MKVLSFVTDGAAVAGMGAELNSGAGQVQLPRGIRVLALKQPTGLALANDAVWTLWVNYASTGQIFAAEALDPINDGGVKLGPTGITVSPGAVIMMAWVQAVAQVNTVTIYYEWM